MAKYKRDILVGQRRPRQVLILLGWYDLAVHRGIARYARQADWFLDSMSTHSTEIRPVWQPDGLICMLGVNPAMDRLANELRLPTVNIGFHASSPFPRVATDNRLLTAMAADHFAERGFRHFAFYFKGLFGPAEMERRDLLRQAVEQRKGTFHLIDTSKVRPSRRTMDAMFSALRLAVRNLPKPLAVLGQTDEIATEIIAACRTEKIRVPEQVAILGIGNNELLCELAPVPVSSIDENLEGSGYSAASLLDDMMSHGRPPKKPVLIAPVRVVTRQSSDILAINDVHVATVLKNVWDHFREPCSVQEMTTNVPMSYRRLHDLFVQHVGHTIFEEILRRRLDLASKLLLETDAKLETIARDVGFSSDKHFRKAFIRKRKSTPSAFRKRFRGKQ